MTLDRNSRSALDAPAELLARREEALGPTYRTFYGRPLHLVRGQGAWLYDASGRAFLDAYNNVASVGHCHPHVVAALARQASILNTHTRYLSEPVVDYAERLLATLPDHLGHIMFTCTGSEAVDLAVRIARHVTGGTSVIVTDHAYHGATAATAAVSPEVGGPGALGREHRTIPAPDTYRQAGLGARTFLTNLERALADLKRNNLKPAALLVDTAFSSDGIFFPAADLIAQAGAIMRQAGGLLIADEVQTGFGRLGSSMWGFERAGLTPDIVTMGKPMGNGHPIGGVACRGELVQNFGAVTGYFNTFGGNPVSAAVGMAVLEVIEQEGILGNARDTGQYLRGELGSLAQRHRLIGDVRGEGLFVGVEIVDQAGAPLPQIASRIVEGLRDKGVLISSTGPDQNVLKIRPPLVFSNANVDQLVRALDEVAAQVD